MKSFVACALMLSSTLGAQNVGIGTTSPTGPLSFASTLGNKIVLWGDGNSNHYGLGVQSGLLQLYSDAASANIAFGYGRSTAFTERMRILNGGNYDGMVLNGRLLIRNGSNDAVGGGGGVWLYKADNSALLGFMGTQNNQNIGFFGGPAGWGFTYDAINSRVGIGNNNPNAPLAFGAVLGKKITLYPGTLGDAGFGIAGNRLQIYSDNPNADVAIGFDAAGTFNERFAVKPTGALALTGNTGSPGEMLVSKGPSQAAAWMPKPTLYYFNAQGNYGIDGNNLCFNINGINGQTFSVPAASMISYQFTVVLYANNGLLGSNSYAGLSIQILNAGNNVISESSAQIVVNNLRASHFHVIGVGDLPAGNYSVRARLVRTNTESGTVYFNSGKIGSVAGCNDININPGQLVIQVFPK